MNKKLIALLIVSIVLIGVTSFLGYLYFIRSQEFRIQPIKTPNSNQGNEMRIMENNPKVQENNITNSTNNSGSESDRDLDNLEKELELMELEDL